MYQRYAIYVTPSGPLGAFGARWLGWDAAAGRNLPHPALDGIDVHRITEAPRKYGPHATIKPPFYLAEGYTAEGLERAAGRLCASLAPVRIERLKLSRLGRFLALTPVGDTPALARMAGRVVRELDVFRAQPDAAELARRKPEQLTEQQRGYLEQWGYPYVMDAFRFHITLTGRLPPEEIESVAPVLEDLIEPYLPEPFIIDRLTLCGQDIAGLFHHLNTFALSAPSEGEADL